ncbi:Oligoendopeptidase F [Clostridiaceae bacterium JG1575]|nr:Oligoendopeptidase F [Clostridiaceae bacterium JG1575]
MTQQPKPESTIKNRNEVDVALTWNLSDLFDSEEAFLEALEALTQETKALVSTYQGKLQSAPQVIEALKGLESIIKHMDRLGHFASLHMASDRTDPLHQKWMMTFGSQQGVLMGELSFFQTELLALPETVLHEAMAQEPNYKMFLEDLLKKKPHTLSKETEKVLARMSEIEQTPYEIYEAAKLADMQFPALSVHGEAIPMTFINFEGELEYEADDAVRREAFRVFSDKLRDYQYTIGTAYAHQVRSEKILSQIRGYESVFDYLLRDQKVERTLYDRQLDVLMEDLAPHMRRYAKLIAKTHGLAPMTYADLKLDLDPEFEPSISVEESKEYILNALSVLGEDYKELLKRALDERWIDFVQNRGKSTGAFCATPVGLHPYILISWTHKMREVFVLAHELGHAGHFYFAGQHQTPLNIEVSTYAVEAPSTMNEMLMANYLMKTSDEPRFRRWVIASIIARTYYHNFVTHFLEGYYQREVYRLVDQGKPLSTEDFSRIFKETLEKFWGDAVELTEGAELTWMRQPHYYMGLYPYTYSAGLTIATQVSQRILKQGQAAVDDWRKVLAAGGTLDPIAFAQTAGVDITTDQALKDTVAYIGSLVDELERLSEAVE